MVSTRSGRDLRDENDEALQIAIKLSQADIRESFKKAKARAPRKTASRMAPTSKTTTPASRNPARVVKQAPKQLTKSQRRTKLVCKLPLDYRKVPHDVVKTWKIRPRAMPKGYWPYKGTDANIKLGHDYWDYLNWRGPSESIVREVHKLLVEYHKKFDFETFVDLPAHAAEQDHHVSAPTNATELTVNVDVIIQTIFAQSTGNENAIDTHSRLCNAFPYTVNGSKHVGKIPNWHDVRHIERDELIFMLQPGGFQESRADAILSLLNNAYSANLERLKNGKNFKCEGNDPLATDFVPRMLSIDYMIEDLKESDETYDEILLGRLLELERIGPKSAMCIMAFAFKRPVFVVDTHVLRYVKWLGWVPPECKSINHAACYLHKYIPKDIAYDLHNQFWVHGANENNRESRRRTVICAICGSTPPAKNRDISRYVRECPLQKFFPPMNERWGSRYKAPNFEEKEDSEPDGLSSGQGEKPTPVGTRKSIVVHNTEKHAPVEPFFGSTSEQSSLWASDDETAVESATQSSSEETDTKVPQSSQPYADAHQDRQPVKKLDLRRRTISWEDVHESQIPEVQAAGYLLFLFRPMDNTFMEDRGKVGRFPRYKWERPDIMDKDCAVTVEEVRAVLYGGKAHKWSKIGAGDVAAAQARNTVTAEV